MIQVVANAQGFCAAKVSFMQPAHGDGGPAIDAWLHAPSDVEVTPDGGYVIADADRLRRVGPDGIISTIYAAGTGVPDFPGSEVHGLVVTPDGDVIFGVDGLRIMRLDTTTRRRSARRRTRTRCPRNPSRRFPGPGRSRAS